MQGTQQVKKILLAESLRSHYNVYCAYYRVVGFN